MAAALAAEAHGTGLCLVRADAGSRGYTTISEPEELDYI